MASSFTFRGTDHTLTEHTSTEPHVYGRTTFIVAHVIFNMVHCRGELKGVRIEMVILGMPERAV